MSTQAPFTVVVLGRNSVSLPSSLAPLRRSDVICGQGVNKKSIEGNPAELVNADYTQTIAANTCEYKRLAREIDKVTRQKKKKCSSGALLGVLAEKKKNLEARRESIVAHVMLGRRFFRKTRYNSLVLIGQEDTDFKWIREKVTSALRDADSDAKKNKRVSRGSAPLMTDRIENHALTKCIDAAIRSQLRSNDVRAADDIDENYGLTMCIDAAVDRILHISPEAQGTKVSVPV